MRKGSRERKDEKGIAEADWEKGERKAAGSN